MGLLEDIEIEFENEQTEKLYNIKLPDPGLLNFYYDLKNRVICLQGDVDDDTLGIVKMIIRFNNQDKNIPVQERKPIKLLINSPGGDVQVMWTLINTIVLSKTPVYTIAYCLAMSAAAHILSSGHKRFAFPGATMLVHSGSVQFNGDVEKVQSAKKFYDAMSKKANEFLLQKTKIQPKDLKKKGATDWYMTAEQALELGLIDSIITNLQEIY